MAETKNPEESQKSADTQSVDVIDYEDADNNNNNNKDYNDLLNSKEESSYVRNNLKKEENKNSNQSENGNSDSGKTTNSKEVNPIYTTNNKDNDQKYSSSNNQKYSSNNKSENQYSNKNNFNNITNGIQGSNNIQANSYGMEKTKNEISPDSKYKSSTNTDENNNSKFSSTILIGSSTLILFVIGVVLVMFVNSRKRVNVSTKRNRETTSKIHSLKNKDEEEKDNSKEINKNNETGYLNQNNFKEEANYNFNVVIDNEKINDCNLNKEINNGELQMNYTDNDSSLCSQVQINYIDNNENNEFDEDSNQNQMNYIDNAIYLDDDDLNIKNINECYKFEIVNECIPSLSYENPYFNTLSKRKPLSDEIKFDLNTYLKQRTEEFTANTFSSEESFSLKKFVNNENEIMDGYLDVSNPINNYDTNIDNNDMRITKQSDYESLIMALDSKNENSSKRMSYSSSLTSASQSVNLHSHNINSINYDESDSINSIESDSDIHSISTTIDSISSSQNQNKINYHTSTEFESSPFEYKIHSSLFEPAIEIASINESELEIKSNNRSNKNSDNNERQTKSKNRNSNSNIIKKNNKNVDDKINDKKDISETISNNNNVKDSSIELIERNNSSNSDRSKVSKISKISKISSNIDEEKIILSTKLSRGEINNTPCQVPKMPSMLTSFNRHLATPPTPQSEMLYSQDGNDVLKTIHESTTIVVPDILNDKQEFNLNDEKVRTIAGSYCTLTRPQKNGNLIHGTSTLATTTTNSSSNYFNRKYSQNNKQEVKNFDSNENEIDLKDFNSKENQRDIFFAKSDIFSTLSSTSSRTSAISSISSSSFDLYNPWTNKINHFSKSAANNNIETESIVTVSTATTSVQPQTDDISLDMDNHGIYNSKSLERIKNENSYHSYGQSFVDSFITLPRKFKQINEEDEEELNQQQDLTLQISIDDKQTELKEETQEHYLKNYQQHSDQLPISENSTIGGFGRRYSRPDSIEAESLISNMNDVLTCFEQDLLKASLKQDQQSKIKEQNSIFKLFKEELILLENPDLLKP